jgi:Tfp pilus assembly protein PilX
MAIKQRYSAPLFFQQGFATLTVALMISFLATFMTIYAAKVGVMEQRISANESRAEEAFAAAEAGIEEGIAYLRGNRKQIDSWGWTPCSGHTDLPCSDGANHVYGDTWSFIQNVNQNGPDYTVKLNKDNGSYILHFLRSIDAPAVLLVLAEGKSADGSGQALLRQGVYFYLYSNGMRTPGAPLIAGGDVDLSGSFSASGNPDANPTNLAVWAGGKVTLGGSTKKGGIIFVDKNTPNPFKSFPTDLFEYIFGVPKKNQQVVKDEATVLTSCGDLNQNSSGLYWIAGDCNPSNDIGSKAAPVLLVVEGNIGKINGNKQIFGLVFSFSSAVQLNGTATVYGSIIVSKDINKSNGNFEVDYDSEVLVNLYSNIGSHGFALIPGSWADY